MVKMEGGEPSDQCPPSLAASDASFVVLENPSFLEVGGPELPGSLDASGRPRQHDGQADSYLWDSMASNVGPEEIQKRLREVHQENLELKEMLSQNNLAMKNQLATLLAWQTQVKAVFQQHGEKFSETGALIHKLRAENTMLKNVIEQKNQTTARIEGSNLEELLQAENAELKAENAELRRAAEELGRRRPSRESPSGKEAELVSLLRQVNERLEAAERARRQLGVDLERAGAQRAGLEAEVARLGARLEDERRDKASLREQMSTLAASKQEQPSASEETLRRQLAELRAQCERLASDKEELSRELDGLRGSEKQSAAYAQSQAQGFQEKLDRLTARLVERDEALASRDAELRKLQLENEGIEILKAQVEVYQSDFNAEREGRERLAGEREQLVEELRLLQRANQELSKELATAKRAAPPPSAPASGGAGWNTIAAPSRSHGQTRQPSPGRQTTHEPARVYDEEVPPPRRYECPICNESFSLLDHLQHHVDTCIND
ncbi:NF-kappa-B essential modulator isoform X1 [Bacillus rossius redtenbacheri]|uniref:NF-kappa-B essential modulator isoform X1 n=1 Tax=Bacillus rossius redtenbacheri TaxID=93214 RepID=UPI002FDE25EF